MQNIFFMFATRSGVSLARSLFYRRSFHVSSVLRDQDGTVPPPTPVETPAVDPASTPKAPPTEEVPQELTAEEIKAQRKARKEAKKKKKAVKKAPIEEDEVEKKKRERKEMFAAKEYFGDGSEIDPKGDDLNDAIIMERWNNMYENDNDRDLLKLRHKFEKEKAPIGSILPSVRYWKIHNLSMNPYNLIRLKQCISKWSKRDLRKFSNEEYQNKKFNTFARMNATDQYWRIFPNILKKFTPVINLIAEFNHPIARDILVYYGNNIPAQFTAEQPKIRFTGARQSAYTLVLVDAKNDEILENYAPSVQWMITNIPGEDGDITKGDELVEYIPPTPIKEFEANRLVFLLFRQRGGLVDVSDTERITKDQFHEREPFDVAEFALQNELLPRGLCFFNCHYDFSVRERYERFGIQEPVFISDEHIERKGARKYRQDVTREGTANKWTWPSVEDLNSKE